MAITVSDVEQKEFAFKGAGYDPYDVDSYLDQICDEMIAMQDRIDELKAKLEEAEAQLEAAKESVKPIPQEVQPIHKTSETLENILISAQRISDEAVENAKKQAQEIVKEAKNEADKLMNEAKEEKGILEKEIKSLKTAALDYRERFLGLLNEHKSLLQADDSVFGEADEKESK